MNIPSLEALELFWDLLEQEPTAAKHLRVKELELTLLQDRAPVLAVDGTGVRRLMLPAVQGFHAQEDTVSGGVQVRNRPMLDRDISDNWIEVVCLKPHLNLLFNKIIIDILDVALKYPTQPDIAAHKVLNLWRELLARSLSSLPSAEEIIGIFGELWYLRQITAISPMGVQNWTGPLRGRHDFTTGNTSLEIKSTTGRTGRRVVIHGHGQLEQLPVPNAKLYLAFVRLEQLPAPAGESIEELVQSILVAGASTFELERRLSYAGFPPEVRVQLQTYRYHVTESRIYLVDEYFPRIVGDSFKGGSLPNGVLHLDYLIDLSSEPPFCLPATDLQSLFELLSRA